LVVTQERGIDFLERTISRSSCDNFHHFRLFRMELGRWYSRRMHGRFSCGGVYHIDL